MPIGHLGNRQLRLAIQRNLVSFPAQLTPLTKRASGDLQERLVQLYFLHRWSVRSLCKRYRLDKAAVQHLLSEWRRRAIAAGYLQEIYPEALEPIAQGVEEIGPPDYVSPGAVVQFAAAGAGGASGVLGASSPGGASSRGGASSLDEILLSALKEECVDRGLALSTAQMERVRRVLRQIA